MKEEKKKWLIVLACGFVAILASVLVFLSDKNVADNYTGEATAKLIDYDIQDEYDAASEMYKTVYYPVLTYSVDGKEYTLTYSQFYSDLPYTIGEDVAIKYDPTNPEKFAIAEDDRGKFIVMWEAPVGIILIAFAFYKLSKLKKLENEN